jgi:oligosaccharide repeat unit polymerase
LYSLRGAILLAQALALMFLAGLGGLYVMFAPRPEPLIRPACVLLTALFAWSVWSWWRLARTLFDPYVLFLTAATLFNAGQALLEALHLNEHGILDGRFTSELILEALFLVMVSLAAFHLGALISAASRRKHPHGEHVHQRRRVPSRQRIRLVGWGLLFISVIPAFLLLRDAVVTVLSSGYFGLYQLEAATGFGATRRVLASFLVPAALFLLAGSQGRRSAIVVSLLVILAYALLQFFLGSRSAAAMPLLAYAWLWHRWVRPLPRLVLVAGAAVLLFVVFPLVRITRITAGSERLSLAALSASFVSIQNPAIAAISEMGGSMMTVAHTLNLVPAVRGFDFGAGYVYALLTLVPNLFWAVHPTIAHGLAAQWLVQTINPAYAALGGGYGFSFIAEAYLNFGWFGAPVILSLMGLLFARFVSWAQGSGEPARVAVVASFLAFFFIFARGESATIIRPLVWYALVPYLVALAIPRLRRARP